MIPGTLSGSAKRFVRRRLRRFDLEVGRPGGKLTSLSIRRMSLPTSVDQKAVRRNSPVAVDIERIVTPFGFSFAEGGWHVHWAAVSAYLNGSSEESCRRLLHDFFGQYCPRTALEALYDREHQDLQPLGLLSSWDTPMIWTMDDKVAARLIRQAPTRGLREGASFGPMTRAKVDAEFDRLRRILMSVDRTGYRPHDFADGFVEGYFLIHHGDYRFVPTEGRHRIAVLRALGYRRIMIVPRHGLAGIDYGDLNRWSRSQGGVYAAGDPQRLFERFFADFHPFQRRFD